MILQCYYQEILLISRYHNHVFECFFITFAYVNNVLLFIEVCNDSGQSPAFLLSNKWNHKSILSFSSSSRCVVFSLKKTPNTFHNMSIQINSIIILMNLEKENFIYDAA